MSRGPILRVRQPGYRMVYRPPFPSPSHTNPYLGLCDAHRLHAGSRTALAIQPTNDQGNPLLEAPSPSTAPPGRTIGHSGPHSPVLQHLREMAIRRGTSIPRGCHQGHRRPPYGSIPWKAPFPGRRTPELYHYPAHPYSPPDHRMGGTLRTL